MKPKALITGGTRGIGAAIADVFEQKGYDLILTGTNTKNVAKRNKKDDPHRHYVAVDFNDSESLKDFLAFIKKIKRLDVCVNNAGINIIKSTGSITEEELDKITAVNYRAPLLISQAVAGIMKKHKQGRIVNIGSIWSVITKPGRVLYCGAKAGLAGFTRAMATDLASHGILVNAVSPGFTLTDLTRSTLSQREIDRLAKQVPLGRMAQPAEIAELVYFLGSPKNTYITGQNILIDGGFANI